MMVFQTDEGWTCRPPRKKNVQHLQRTSEWTERWCPHPEDTWRTSRNSGDTPLWQCALPCPGVLRGLPLQVTVFTDEGEEIAREGLDGGQTLSLPPCSSKGLVLEASHSLQGPIVLLRPLVWARRVPGSISACQDVIYSICQDVVLFIYGGSLQEKWSNNR